MDMVPAVKAIPFEQLKPGEICLCADTAYNCYALRTDRPYGDGNSTLVLLGPTFIQDLAESFLVSWHPSHVLSFGSALTLLPSLDSKDWSLNGPSRTPVCLAVAGRESYVCTNGGPSPQHYLPCFVNIRTGEIIEGRLPGPAAFTSHWEVAVVSERHPPRIILKYPLP